MAAKRKKKAAMGRPRVKPRAPAFDREVGRRIRERKKAAGLSDQGLADAIDRSVSQVYRYQSGDTSVDAPTLAALAMALGCTTSDLVDGIAVKP